MGFRLGATLASPGSIAFSPDGARLATAWGVNGTLLAAVCADQVIRLWETDTGAEVRRSPMDPFFNARSAAFTPDLSLVAVTGVGRDTTVRLWNPLTGEDLGRLVGHRGRANAWPRTPPAPSSPAAEATLCGCGNWTAVGRWANSTTTIAATWTP